MVHETFLKAEVRGEKKAACQRETISPCGAFQRKNTLKKETRRGSSPRQPSRKKKFLAAQELRKNYMKTGEKVSCDSTDRNRKKAFVFLKGGGGPNISRERKRITQPKNLFRE